MCSLFVYVCLTIMNVLNVLLLTYHSCIIYSRLKDVAIYLNSKNYCNSYDLI